MGWWIRISLFKLIRGKERNKKETGFLKALISINKKEKTIEEVETKKTAEVETKEIEKVETNNVKDSVHKIKIMTAIDVIKEMIR